MGKLGARYGKIQIVGALQDFSEMKKKKKMPPQRQMLLITLSLHLKVCHFCARTLWVLTSHPELKVSSREFKMCCWASVMQT